MKEKRDHKNKTTQQKKSSNKVESGNLIYAIHEKEPICLMEVNAIIRDLITIVSGNKKSFGQL